MNVRTLAQTGNVPAQRPAAPPVYRPQGNTNPIAQPKAGGWRIETRPGPPVYRPSVGNSLQNKPAMPPAPPRYHPPIRSSPGLLAKPASGVVRSPARHPNLSGKSATAGASAIQRYETLSAERIFPSEGAINVAKRRVAVIPDNDLNFIWQQKKSSGSFLGSGEDRANLKSASQTTLRVSDDFQMAIQDTDLSARQPKVFYATDKVFLDSRTKLREVGSTFELVKTSRVLTLWDGASTKRRLTQLFPQKRTEPVREPLSLRSKQECDAMAEEVTGSPKGDLYPTSGHLMPVRDVLTSVEMGGLSQIAAVVAELMKTSAGDRGVSLVDARDAQENQRITQEIAVEYNQALSDLDADRLDRVLRYLQINRYAVPEVGDAFVIGSVAGADHRGHITDLRTSRTFAPRWNYHFAGVVAKSGSDTVTMENYSRGDEVVGHRTADPRWYFQMYGGRYGQSFHEANIALGGYANPVTSALHNERRTELAARRRRQRQQVAALMKKVKVGIRMLAPFLLVVVVLIVLHRFGII